MCVWIFFDYSFLQGDYSLLQIIPVLENEHSKIEGIFCEVYRSVSGIMNNLP